MNDNEQFLSSRPILGYQLDATHLQNVLQRLAKQNDALQTEQQANRERNRGVEDAINDLASRVSRLENALQNVGNPEELRDMKEQLIDVSRAVDEINTKNLPQMQRQVDDAQRNVDRAAQKAVQMAVAPIEAKANEVLEVATREIDKVVNDQRQVTRELQRDRQKMDEQFRDRGLGQQQKLVEDVRALTERVDHVERDVCNPLRDAVEEMQQTTNNNFQQIEQATRIFDSEIAKLKAEMANLRSDLNGFENNVTNNVARLREDLDTKFNMLVDMMKSFERNNQLFETAIAEAGKRMTDARAQAAQREAQMSNAVGSGRPIVGGGTNTPQSSSYRR